METKDAVVTPWEVRGDIDYQRLVKEFGTQPLTDELLEKLRARTKDTHFLLRRKIFFSHRNFDWLLNQKEFFLYTGRGPSGQIHIGHLLPWIFTKWVQDKFKAPLYFQITDDEKFYAKTELGLDDTRKWGYENALDIIAVGFDHKRTKIFLDTDYIKTLYPIAAKVAKKITYSTAKAVFGFTPDTNIGMIFYTALQSAPCFLEDKPCLIPLAIDQDNHFRITADVAPKLGYRKPALLHAMFLPPLSGTMGKMSTSTAQDTIFTTDTAKEVEMKIKKYAFSGGQTTMGEHRAKGGNPDIDVSYQYLRMLFEPDDKKLERIYEDYKSGKLLSGELKAITIEKVNVFLREHQKKREKAKKQLDRFILKD